MESKIFVSLEKKQTCAEFLALREQCQPRLGLAASSATWQEPASSSGSRPGGGRHRVAWGRQAQDDEESSVSALVTLHAGAEGLVLPWGRRGLGIATSQPHGEPSQSADPEPWTTLASPFGMKSWEFQAVPTRNFEGHLGQSLLGSTKPTPTTRSSHPYL